MMGVNKGYVPNAVKYDGINDYLIRGATITGIADGQKGTLSCWLRFDGGDGANQIIFSEVATSKFAFIRNSSNFLSLIGKNSASTTILSSITTALFTAGPGWYHFLSSWDLSVPTGTTYINDVSSAFGTATNDTLDYTVTNWNIAADSAFANKFNGAMSELYFTTTYLDLTTTSNRRKFITAALYPVSLGTDGSVPTGTAPLVYMKDPAATAGTNSGTGGAWTLTGTAEKASTDPSTRPVWLGTDYDGTTNGYITTLSTSMTGNADGKTGTVSMWVRCDGSDATLQMLWTNNGKFGVERTTANKFRVWGQNAAAATILDLISTTAYPVSPAWIHILMSWDLANAKGFIYINNVADTTTTTNTNDTIDYAVAGSPEWGLGSNNLATLNFFNGCISEFIFSESYIDISVAANRATFVTAGVQPVDVGTDGSTPFGGSAPQMYVKTGSSTNAGSGGAFFALSGTVKQAASTPNYYYAESALFDGTNDYMTRGASTDLTGIVDGKAGLFSCWVRFDGRDLTQSFFLVNLAGTVRFSVEKNTSNNIIVTGKNSAGTTILLLTGTNPYSTTVPVPSQWHHILASWDLAATTGYLYIDNASDLLSSTLTNDTIDYVTATPNWAIGANTSGTAKLFATIADMYFTNTYLDISTVANRAKFIDAATLRPVFLGTTGQTPTGSTPLIYLPNQFSAFQTNLGSGGNFTVTGALTRGTTSPSDVKA